MNRIINYQVPEWLKEVNFDCNSFLDIPTSIFEEVNVKLDRLQNGFPHVSVIIAAYNEEVNVLRCIRSLSNTKYKSPLEIIVVNNNSNDRTQDTLDQLHVRKLFQPIQGCGPARQLAQENAKGKYILLADADCLYPAEWIEEMLKVLEQPDIACVYGRYSFIPAPGYTRGQLFIHEKLKDLIAVYRHYKRPYLNAFGISMGYVKEYGLKVGYVMHNIRGEDGRLAFDLMKYGRIAQVKATVARPWTGIRTLQRDGNYYQALKKRMHREVKRFFTVIKSEKPHDTKTIQ